MKERNTKGLHERGERDEDCVRAILFCLSPDFTPRKVDPHFSYVNGHQERFLLSAHLDPQGL